MKRFLRLLPAIVVIALTPVPTHSQPTLGDEWRREVERFAQSLVDAQLVPGMGIAITQGEQVVYSEGFGLADAQSGRPVDQATVFYIASSTKALTATAVLALSARKEIELGRLHHTLLAGVARQGPPQRRLNHGS